MKGIQGLIVALGLGIVGAMFNWAYLNRRAGDFESISFIGIKPDVSVARGQRLTEEHLARVEIPAKSVGNLADFAFRWSARQSVINSPVWRTLTEGSLLMVEDLKTPPLELQFGQDSGPGGQEEVATWVPVDNRTFVPSLVVPGDWVSFRLPGSRLGFPTLAASGEAPDPDAKKPATAGQSPPKAEGASGSSNLIGPFKVLALGNRLGSSQVMRAARISQQQENVMAISVKLNNKRLETKAETLFRHLEATNFRGVAVLLHPRKTGR